jgi:cholesterol oxidase
MSDFDVIVIGSGFGGAITACRLSEAGYKVLVLERGRRWDVQTFPREADDPWVWDHRAPQSRNGWFELRVFPHMTVVQGAGVGGGSLVYANISIPAKPKTFASGWPAEITFDELKPFYQRVGQMLDVKPVPPDQWPERTKLLRDGANATGDGARFEPLELAVSFDPDWRYELPNAHSTARSKTFVNPHGKEQGTCVHLGNCDVGCDVNARNTLDLNYLAVAETKGADVRPLHLVTAISQEGDEYRVSYNQIDPDARSITEGSATARIVIIAAGSLGSTELLLKCRDQLRTLPNVSANLGVGWSSNGDFLTPAIHPFRLVKPSRGPTITAAINLLEAGAFGQDVFIEDGGIPDLVGNALARWAADPAHDPQARLIIESLRPLLTANTLGDHVMPWFAQARDAADGRLTLKNGSLHLDWNVAASRATMNAVVRKHQELAVATGGMALTPVTWTIGGDLITPHPLGGCRLGATAADGVVAHTGEVFGHRNLYVADGAIVPKAIGLNPSRTIGALAERIASLIVAESR